MNTLLLLACLLMLAPARACETNALTRDPSTIVKENGTYWLYGTGEGIAQWSSADRVHWTNRGPVFLSAPAWLADAVPPVHHNFAWAPDIRRVGGRWLLYYCYSIFGTNNSAIGVAENRTLNPKTWKDFGLVIASKPGADFNAIDPCIAEDAAHGLWLSFGSYYTGIKLMRIDPATGRQSATDATLYPLAARPNQDNNALEASTLAYHGGWYYLFVNWGTCCQGPRSTYNIRVGRAPSVTGPYVDKTGKAMRDGGGFLFLGSVHDDGTGRPCDDRIGPGHAGVFHDADGDWVSFHEEWSRTNGGVNAVNILRLAWDADGWPRAVLDAGPYQITSALATHGVLSVAGTSLQTGPDTGQKAQRWALQFQQDGFYCVVNSASGKALTLADATPAPGAKATLAALTRQNSQLWRLRQNENGTWTLLPKTGKGALALDVSGCNLSDGTPVGTWSDNNLACQQWTLHAP